MYEFDLKTLWSTIWNRRKYIMINMGLAAVFGVVIAYSIPKVFVSEVELVAEVKSAGGIGGGAASLASLAGIKMGSSEESIVPELYPNVMSSNSFLVDLLSVPVATLDGDFKGTYQEYLKNETRAPWWSYPAMWIRSLLSSSSSDAEGNTTIDPQHLSPELFAMINGVKTAVQCNVSDGDGLINIVARAQDPLVAKILVDSATMKLQKFITEYRTSKARIDLEYYQKLAQESLNKYKDAQHAYAVYSDSHKGLTSEAYIMERTTLENDVQLYFSAYSQMAQQVQMAMAKVQENTPAFTTINAASIAPLADSPKKKIIVFAIIFLSFLGSVGWIYFRLLFKNVNSANHSKVEKAGE